MLYVGQTPSNGRGLFSYRTLTPGCVILVLGGKRCRDIYDRNYQVGPAWLGVDDYTWLVPAPRSYWRYVNHSCDPNCYVKGGKALVALRAIPPHQELTIDYSTTEADPYWSMNCNCGIPDARRRSGPPVTMPPGAAVGPATH